MTYFVYLIGSYKLCKLITYVGYTNNLKKRLELHNNGKGAKFTRGKKWRILYSEKCGSKIIAMRREYIIKKDRKFRNYIKNKVYENINFTSI